MLTCNHRANHHWKTISDNFPFNTIYHNNCLMSELSQRHPFLIFLSSTTASLLSTVVTNPLEIMKLNRQYIPITCPQYPNKCT